MDDTQRIRALSERGAKASAPLSHAKAAARLKKLVEQSRQLNERVTDGYLGVGWPAEGEAEADIAA
jgi:anti-sigma factor RsiW